MTARVFPQNPEIEAAVQKAFDVAKADVKRVADETGEIADIAQDEQDEVHRIGAVGLIMCEALNLAEVDLEAALTAIAQVIGSVVGGSFCCKACLMDQMGHLVSMAVEHTFVTASHRGKVAAPSGSTKH